MGKQDHDLSPWAARIKLPVLWGDMDAFGHVNNTVYFRYFESARIAYFDQIGMLEYMEETGIGPILAHTECRFRIPLRYPDTVLLDARARDLKNSEFYMDYRVISEKANDVAAIGSGRIVCVDYKSSGKVPVPDKLKSAIEALENNT